MDSLFRSWCHHRHHSLSCGRSFGETTCTRVAHCVFLMCLTYVIVERYADVCVQASRRGGFRLLGGDVFTRFFADGLCSGGPAGWGA